MSLLVLKVLAFELESKVLPLSHYNIICYNSVYGEKKFV